jgi:hypothetical protein
MNAVDSLEVPGTPKRASVTFVSISKGLGERMVIWAEKAQIFGPVVPGVAVYVIDVQRHAARSRIAFAPSADAAGVAVRFQEVPADPVRGAIEVTPRSLDFAGKPSLDVFVVMKGRTTLVRAKDERIFAHKVAAAVPFTR